MKDPFFGGFKNFVPTSIKLWIAFGSRFFLGFLFIRAELFKKPVDIVSFVNEALGPHWFVIGLAAICYVAPVLLFRIFEKGSKRNFSNIRRKVFIVIFEPLGVWYSDIIGVLMYISGVYAGHAHITGESLSAGYSMLMAFSSFFLHNYIEKNKAFLTMPQPLEEQ